jgi:hypothetical protein
MALTWSWTMKPPTDLVPVVEAARVAGITPERIRRAFHSGRLPGNIVAGRILVDPESVLALVAAAAHAAAGFPRIPFAR